MRREVISTTRLSLCSPTPEDFVPLFERVFSDPEVMRYVFAGLPLTREAATTLYAENFDHDASGRGLGVLVERSSDEVVGFSGLVPCKALGQDDLELGFVLAKQAWNKGYAQEIGRAQLAFGFAKLQCSRLLAQVSPENTISISVLVKIGMQLHSTINSPDRGARHVFLAERA